MDYLKNLPNKNDVSNIVIEKKGKNASKPMGKYTSNTSTLPLSQSWDYEFKLLIIGNARVGKSSMTLRFLDNVFNEHNERFISPEFKIHNLESNGNRIKLQIWDNDGRAGYYVSNVSLGRIYKGVHAIIAVYDITDPQSFLDLDRWFHLVEEHAPKSVVCILAGNKSDLENRRAITYQEGKAYAEKRGMLFLETSAKAGLNVQELFQAIVEQTVIKTMEIEGEQLGVWRLGEQKPRSSGCW